jgi:hypothetical protein
VSLARAISASGEWNPKARRVISRIWVLIASTRALERPCWMAARMPARCSVIVRELDERRQAAAPGPRKPRLEQPGRFVGGEPVDLAQLFFEQVGAVQPGVGALDV